MTLFTPLYPPAAPAVFVWTEAIVRLFVIVIVDVAPVSLPITVNWVDFAVLSVILSINTDIWARVALLSTSSSPKKNGVVAPGALSPAPVETFILTTDLLCSINV